jgi:flagellar motor switch protein FliM
MARTSSREMPYPAQCAWSGALLSVSEMATGVTIDARPGDIHQGPRRELLSRVERRAVYCEAIHCRLVQRHLQPVRHQTDHRHGGMPARRIRSQTSSTFAARPLSGIELDMSLVVFEQLNDSLSRRCGQGSDRKGQRGQAATGSIPRQRMTRLPDFHAAALTLDFAVRCGRSRP